MKKIAVIGAGGTGVALSAILASKGHEVYLTDNLNQTVVEAAQEAGVLRTKGTKVCEGALHSSLPTLRRRSVRGAHRMLHDLQPR